MMIIFGCFVLLITVCQINSSRNMKDSVIYNNPLIAFILSLYQCASFSSLTSKYVYFTFLLTIFRHSFTAFYVLPSSQPLVSIHFCMWKSNNQIYLTSQVHILQTMLLCFMVSNECCCCYLWLPFIPVCWKKILINMHFCCIIYIQ